MNIGQEPLRLVATILFTVAGLGLHGPAWSAEPLRGNCHMDICSWSNELSRDFLGSTVKGTLYEIRLLGGSSTHRDGRYERKAPIRWNAKPQVSYVFCSKTLPMVMGRYDGDKLQVDFLQIGQGVIGAYLSSLSLYAFVCHNTRINDEVSFAKRFGYKPALTEFEGLENRLVRPDDILRQ